MQNALPFMFGWWYYCRNQPIISIEYEKSIITYGISGIPSANVRS